MVRVVSEEKYSTGEEKGQREKGILCLFQAWTSRNRVKATDVGAGKVIAPLIEMDINVSLRFYVGEAIAS